LLNELRGEVKISKVAVLIWGTTALTPTLRLAKINALAHQFVKTPEIHFVTGLVGRLRQSS
jgi:hypothetical protein